MIAYRAYKPFKYLTSDTYIQKIRVNKKLKTITILEEYKIDNNVINTCDDNEIKKHLNKDFFNYCKGCLKVGRKKHYYISTTKGIKEIKSGYVVTHKSVSFGYNLESGIFFVTHIPTGLLVDSFNNLYDLKNSLPDLVEKVNTTNLEQLRDMRRKFLKEIKKFREKAAA